MAGKVVITAADGSRSVGLPVSGGADHIKAFAERMAPQFKQRWKQEVTVKYQPAVEEPETDPNEGITFDLGNLPETEG